MLKSPPRYWRDYLKLPMLSHELCRLRVDFSWLRQVIQLEKMPLLTCLRSNFTIINEMLFLLFIIVCGMNLPYFLLTTPDFLTVYIFSRKLGFFPSIARSIEAFILLAFSFSLFSFSSTSSIYSSTSSIGHFMTSAYHFCFWSPSVTAKFYFSIG